MMSRIGRVPHYTSAVSTRLTFYRNQNQLDKKVYGRMPWHDVSVGIRGPAVLDIAEHFVGVSSP
jgi:phosphatidylserine/phosphatidylglycerophosphate/cardiolipin synthase-like enzyme